MPTDAEFLTKLLADPSDDGTRLVYADWLDERGDPGSAARAEFLRLTADVQGRKRDTRKRTRLQQLAPALESDWLAVVSRLAVENCQGQRRRAEPPPSRQIHWRYLCDRRWEDLRTTGDANVRVCEGCQENVHYCDTIGEARAHAWAGHCIAVDLGVLRRDRDLEPQAMYLGRPSAHTLQREHERMQPDAVSAQR